MESNQGWLAWMNHHCTAVFEDGGDGCDLSDGVMV